MRPCGAARLIPLLVFGIACRGSGGGCGENGSAKDAEPSARAKDAAVAMLGAKTSTASEQSYASKYLVIISSSDTPGQALSSLQFLGAHPELGAEIVRLQSAHFKNLAPCLEVVVAKAALTKSQAIAFWKRLKQAGLDAYVKNAGPYVGKTAALDAYCARKKLPPPPETCGMMQFVEQWDGRAFLGVQNSRLPQSAGKLPLKMFNDRVWTATIAETDLGADKRGDEFSLYDVTTKEPLATCRVAGFLVMVRGTPHFSYGKSEDGEEEEPSEPGCGSREPFAELACSALPDPEVGVNLVAVPAKAKQPAIYEELEVPEQDAKILDAQATEIAEASDAYRRALKEATARATEEKAELETSQKVRVFKHDRRKVAVVEIELFTGEGNTLCGSEDVRIDLRGVYELSEKRIGRAIGSLRRVGEGDLSAVIDIEGDGRLELMVTAFPDRRIIQTPDEATLCESSIPYCDCPC